MTPVNASSPRPTGSSNDRTSTTATEDTPAVGRRVEYVVACQAGRQAIERARIARLNGQQHRVLEVVLAKTVLYSKLSDRLYAQEIAAAVYGCAYTDVSKRQRNRTSEMLGELRDLALIEYQPGRGRGVKSAIGIPSPEKYPGSGGLMEARKSTPDQEDFPPEKYPGSGDEKYPGSGGATEKRSEKRDGAAVSAEVRDAFRDATAQVSPVGSAQQARWLAAFAENADGYLACLANVLSDPTVRNAARVLDAKITAGEHRAARGPGSSVDDRARSWAKNVGSLLERHGFEDELRTWSERGLPPDVVAELQAEYGPDDRVYTRT